jgi:predicted tellurium resistance membrane protein TerC
MELPFQQIFIPSDIALIGMLVILEGILSIDNALVLGILAKRLPKEQQGRALTYGLVGAFAFRFIAIFFAQLLLQWTIVKLIGGGYLLFVAGKYFLYEAREEKDEHIEIGPDGHPILIDDDTGGDPSEKSEDAHVQARTPVLGMPERSENPSQPSSGGATKESGKKFAKFWPTVAMIELTDIAFAVDSILAAIAMVGTSPYGTERLHPKLWVVVTGGMLGVILMRVAAVLFIKLLEKFPRFEVSAYLLVAVIGFKLIADWWFNTADNPHAIDFHSPSQAAFWIFWLAMIGSLAFGFIPKKRKKE